MQGKGEDSFVIQVLCRVFNEGIKSVRCRNRLVHHHDQRLKVSVIETSFRDKILKRIVLGQKFIYIYIQTLKQ